MTRNLRAPVALFLLLISVMLSLPAQSAEAVTHELSWQTLSGMSGHSISDPNVSGTLIPPLKAILAEEQVAVFSDEAFVQKPIEVADGVLIIKAIQPHSEGDNASFAFFSRDGSLAAIIKRGDRLQRVGSTMLLQHPRVARYISSN